MPLDFSKQDGYRKKDKNVQESVIHKKAEYRVQKPKYTFEDIILTEKQYTDIMLAVGYDKNKNQLMETWGMKALYPEYGGLFINLYGESGTGKTMTAHAIASSLNKEIVMVNYAEIESKYVGETSKNLVSIFDFAVNHNAVLIFDEADALLSKRVTNMTNSTDVSVNQTKSVLLNIMNDYQGTVVFTTNFISNYDFAFLRRIPFQIKFPLPDENQRKSLWNHYLSADMPYRLDVDDISRQYEGISGSDIANCVFMAALYAVLDKKDVVTENYFIRSLENVMTAKKENQAKEPHIVSQREVTEEYALKQIGGK